MYVSKSPTERNGKEGDGKSTRTWMDYDGIHTDYCVYYAIPMKKNSYNHIHPTLLRHRTTYSSDGMYRKVQASIDALSLYNTPSTP